MKALLRIAAWITAIVIILVGVFVLVLLVLYPAEHVRRTLVYLDADVYDYQKFPERSLAPAADPLHFTLPDDPAAAAAQVRAAFTRDTRLGSDLEAFLEDSGTQALIVIQDGTLLYESYHNRASRESIVTSFSVAKSFVSSLIAVAIEEGRITSLDDPVTRYLPELAARDARFEQISLRHLVNMSSGIHYVEMGLPFSDDALTYYYPDLRRLALEHTRITGRPGETWLYNNYHPLLLGLVLERTTQMHVAEYLEQKIWQPMGAEYPGSWSLDSVETGFEKMESGINGRAIDFAKLGQLYLDGGRRGGQQVLPEAWVQAATRLDPAVDRAVFYQGQLDPPYGQVFHQRLWWGVQQDGGGYGFAAQGNHGQIVFVWPEKRLVMVRHGERYGVETGWLDLFVTFAGHWQP